LSNRGKGRIFGSAHLKLIWAIVSVIVAGLVLGWWASSTIQFEPPRLNQNQTLSRLERASSVTAGMASSNVTRLTPEWGRRPARPHADVETNWQYQVDAILAATDEDETTRAKQLLQLMPNLPLEGQVEVAQHVERMLPDQDYGELGRYLMDPETPEPLLDTLLSGVLKRPDGIRLPLLLSIASDEDHPKSEEAIDYLEGLLGDNFGTNWSQWTTSVVQQVEGTLSPGDSTPPAPAQSQ